MFGTYFYHQRIRKSVSLFGTLFNNIHVIRKDSSGGIINTQKVPLSYAPKQKFLGRLRDVPDLVNDTKVAMKLPRMSFEIVALAYDSTRQLPKNNKISLESNLPGTRNTIYTPIPYLLTFSLNVYAKSQDDALQIVEQIIPYFAPQYTLTVKPFSEYSDIVEDIPITLQSVAWSDDYDGPQESRRTIVYTLDFEMKVSFSGPVTDGQKVITSSITEFHLMEEGLADSDVLSHRIKYTANPIDIQKDSDYGFITEYDWEGFSDDGGFI